MLIQFKLAKLHFSPDRTYYLCLTKDAGRRDGLSAEKGSVARLDVDRPPRPEHGQVPQRLLQGGASGLGPGLRAPAASLSGEETGSGILEMNIDAGNWS